MGVPLCKTDKPIRVSPPLSQADGVPGPGRELLIALPLKCALLWGILGFLHSLLSHLIFTKPYEKMRVFPFDRWECCYVKNSGTRPRGTQITVMFISNPDVAHSETLAFTYQAVSSRLCPSPWGLKAFPQISAHTNWRQTSLISAWKTPEHCRSPCPSIKICLPGLDCRLFQEPLVSLLSG